MGRKRVESHGRIARHEEPAKRRHQKDFGILEEDIRRRSSIGSRLSESAQKLHGNPEVLPNPTEPAANGRRMGCAHGGHRHSRTLLVEAPSSAGQGRLVAGEHGADRLRRNPRRACPSQRRARSIARRSCPSGFGDGKRAGAGPQLFHDLCAQRFQSRHVSLSAARQFRSSGRLCERR